MCEKFLCQLSNVKISILWCVWLICDIMCAVCECKKNKKGGGEEKNLNLKFKNERDFLQGGWHSEQVGFWCNFNFLIMATSSFYQLSSSPNAFSISKPQQTNGKKNSCLYVVSSKIHFCFLCRVFLGKDFCQEANLNMKLFQIFLRKHFQNQKS